MSESLQAPLNRADPVEWRTEQLEKAGVPKSDAKWLANGDADLHQMLDALAAGCSIKTLNKIFGE